MTEEELIEATKDHPGFSKQLPGQQLVIDSHSLGLYKECPRKYLYQVILGWNSKVPNPHLFFGIGVHRALEVFDIAVAEGEGAKLALDKALDFAFKFTWNVKLKRPWDSNHATKHRISLLRTVIWYVEAIGANDPMTTLILNGKPAIELKYQYPSGYKTENGELIQLCGRLDRVAELNGSTYVIDRKTTSKELSPRYFSQFTPFDQFSHYVGAGEKIGLGKISGIMLEGMQIGSKFSRFQRQPIPRTPQMINEWKEGLGYWFGVMEATAAHRNWPMNEKACSGPYGDCAFRSVCSRNSTARQQLLELDFEQKRWDPTVDQIDDPLAQ